MSEEAVSTIYLPLGLVLIVIVLFIIGQHTRETPNVRCSRWHGETYCRVTTGDRIRVCRQTLDEYLYDCKRIEVTPSVSGGDA